MAITILDGPMGTELLALGVPTPLPGWSAHAIESAPAMVGEVHRAYARAGATVHTTNTFRTRARVFPDRWGELAASAVELARGAAPKGHRIAGSIAPLEDCYRPDLSPSDPGPEHAALARVLASSGCDLLLCETFPHVGEALRAVEAGLGTGLEVWVSFTAGPGADLLTPRAMAEGADAAVGLGASAVLVNCVPVARTIEFVRALVDAVGGRVAVGAYANAGEPEERMGWRSAPDGAGRYADAAESWVEAGATIVGGCCGTGPGHVGELARRFGASPDAAAR